MRQVTRVLVVDDSALVRQMLCRVLGEAPDIEVVGTAATGMEAIAKARDLVPDVVTLDIQMPDLSGVEALPHIVRSTPARVIMLTAIDDPDVAYEALSKGATDFVVKPKQGLASSLPEFSQVLVEKILVASRVRPELRVPSAPPAAPRPGAHARVAQTREDAPAYLVGIAASTGGPPALETIFSSLDASVPATYVVVQHLPAGFTDSLARRLTRVTDMTVALAEPGTIVRAGVCYIAPHGTHTVVQGRAVVRLASDDADALHGVRPAADPLFESMAATVGERAVGVVLTGMGADGARGLLAIRRAGGTTIAQDEETSVVWGMPGAAVRAEAVSRVVPITQVADEIRRAVRR